ncbi:MAG: hypothetical protein ABI742_03900 [Gemmatimonadota bacterium]
MSSTGTDTPAATQDYWVYGLRVRSAIELPGWPTVKATEPDVNIRLEPVPAIELEGPPYTARSVVVHGELRLAVLGVGRYAAIGGSLIRVDPDPDAKVADLRLYLTGVLMGAILHQRGIYPLHASCVALRGDGGGVGFAGRSGAGKSTLVATMVRRGADFVSDDLCVMAPRDPAGLRVWPGAARVKLQETTWTSSPGTVSDLDPAGGNRGKYHFPMNASLPQTSPVPLNRVYLLTDGEGPPRVERLTGLEAISALVDDTYFLASAQALGLARQVFKLAAAAANALSVRRLVRPRGLEHLPAMATLIEHDAQHHEGGHRAVRGGSRDER